MKRLRGFLGVFLIFVFGVICGAVLATGVINQKIRGVVEGGPEKVVDVVVTRLRKELKLDQEQEQMLQHIVNETRIKLAALRQQTQPQVEEALEQAERKVRGILKPEQTRKFDNIVQKGRERWKSERKD